MRELRLMGASCCFSSLWEAEAIGMHKERKSHPPPSSFLTPKGKASPAYKAPSLQPKHLPSQEPGSCGL